MRAQASRLTPFCLTSLEVLGFRLRVSLCCQPLREIVANKWAPTGAIPCENVYMSGENFNGKKAPTSPTSEIRQRFSYNLRSHARGLCVTRLGKEPSRDAVH